MCTQQKCEFLVKSNSTILYYIDWRMGVLVRIKLFLHEPKKEKRKIGYSPVSAVRELEEFGLV